MRFNKFSSENTIFGYFWPNSLYNKVPDAGQGIFAGLHFRPLRVKAAKWLS
jgi:hypothetical protein